VTRAQEGDYLGQVLVVVVGPSPSSFVAKLLSQDLP
jgi:hypothetical protein